MNRPTSPEVLVVADDLSGAADCAIAWAGAGVSAVVALEAARALADAATPTVLAVDTDSRRLGPEAAAARVRAAVARHAGPACRVLYKKIDSTLRGSVAAEVAAAAGEARFAIVAPAFPATGRTTEAGRVRVAGAPLEATELWRREGDGHDPDLPAWLAEAALPTATASLALVRGGGLGAWLRAQRRAGQRAAVCDAVTEADLAVIAAAGQGGGADGPLLWVGSAGLARHLVSASAGGGAGPVLLRRRPGRPILVVVGSLAAASRAQLRQLAAAPGVSAWEETAEALRSGDAAVAGRLAAALEGSVAPVLALSIGGGAVGDPAALAAALGRLVAPALAAGALGGLVATGGETARALLAAARVPALALAGEVEPGVPLASALGPGPVHGLPVITKAGAFGSEETLLRCVEALRDLPETGDDAPWTTTSAR